MLIGGLSMDEAKKTIKGLIENYFYDCEQNGYSDFDVWCEDNINTEQEEKLFNEVKDHVYAIASILY